MQGEIFKIEQDASTLKLIESSLYRCSQMCLPAFSMELPKVSEEAKAKSLKHITGHTMLIRESQPRYYQALSQALTSQRACLYFVAPNFDVYGRIGSEELKTELKRINLRVGANLSEETIGTNAAVISAHSQNGVWTVGAQNYARVLRDYALYSFTVHGKYSRFVHILLVCRADGLSEATVGLFKLVEAVESLSSAGLLTEDIAIKEAAVSNNYLDGGAENIFIVVGKHGQITSANEGFYSAFHMDNSEVVNYKLEDIVPELAYISEEAGNGRLLPRPRQITFSRTGNWIYSVTCTPINQDDQISGMVISAQRIQPKSLTKSAEGSGSKYTLDDIIGTSKKFSQLKQFAARIADTKCTVLIQGESGTGKELFAHSIHSESERWGKPFVSVNCAAIPRELIGSELFGYVGGAFTGANRTGAKGKFELASGGTLFLDEIGEMPIDMQSVLLRAIEENSITRIGGAQPIPVDVRLVVATNQNLEEYIAQGKFRLDLFYRLNVVSLNTIPLREHAEDIPELVEHFIDKFSKTHKKQVNGVAPEAMSVLISYDWPGNVRELRNAIEYGVITCNGVIELKNLPGNVIGIRKGEAWDGRNASAGKQFSQFQIQRKETVRQLMKKYAGNKSKVAAEMGIARTTLYRILNEMK